MKRPKLLRAVYTVQHDRRLDAWVVLAGPVVIAAYRRRKDAEATGRVFAGLTFHSGELHAGKAATHALCSQLRTRSRAGRWGLERTYGFDPKHRKG